MRRRTEHPRVLAAAALAAVDDEFALGQGNPGKSAWKYPDALAVVDRERSKINMTWLQTIVDQGRHRGQLDDRLRDPTARVLGDALAQCIQLGLAGAWTDHDALAAGAIDGLDDELLQAVEHLLAGVVVLESPG